MKPIGVLIFIVGFTLQMSAQFTEKHCKTIRDFVHIMQNYHYVQPTKNENSNLNFKQNTLEFLDPSHILFTKNDSIEVINMNFDVEQISKIGSCSGMKQVATLYKRCLMRTDSLVNSLVFTENISLSPMLKVTDKQVFANDFRELKQQLTNSLYLQTLTATHFSVSTDARLQFEKIKTNYQCEIKRELSDFENRFIEDILNAYAYSYDPHTTFFSASEKSLFETILQSNSFSYGISFTEDEQGNITVDDIVPGGPAWRSMQFQEGDILIAMMPESAVIADSLCFDIETIYQILNNPDYHIIKFKIKKKNEEIIEISLVNEVLENNENNIIGYILSGENRTGYVRIPDFYSSANDSVNTGCSTDLTRALIDMKNENIESLIVDLRNNTGGSVEEAKQMCGLFIDYGVIGLYAERDGKIIYLKDNNKGTIYSGPLVILVNEYSASASEIFASAMQDYRRAVIVGTKTYGKGTAQVIKPVTDTPEKIDIVDVIVGIPGYLKITVNKMYRITGKTHQLNAVMPDIELPSSFMGAASNESQNINAIDGNPTEKKVYYTPFSPFPTAELIKNSEQRCASWRWSSDSLFGEWQMFCDLNHKQPVSPVEYSKLLDEITRMIQAQVLLAEMTHSDFEIIETKKNLNTNKLNPVAQKYIQKHIEDLKKDRYIYESYKILQDMLMMQK